MSDKRYVEKYFLREMLPEIPKCKVRRGGVRSYVFCEQPEGHVQLIRDWHAGRSHSGRWFFWSVD